MDYGSHSKTESGLLLINENDHVARVAVHSKRQLDDRHCLMFLYICRSKVPSYSTAYNSVLCSSVPATLSLNIFRGRLRSPDRTLPVVGEK